MDIKKPNRVTRSFIQRLVAGPERVFPLLCPVREADWIEGWDPVLVLSETGLAEPDCVFVTGSADQRAIWFISRHRCLCVSWKFSTSSGFCESTRTSPPWPSFLK